MKHRADEHAALADLAVEMATLVASRVEPKGLQFVLFLHDGTTGGHVLQVSRDRELAAKVVATWLHSQNTHGGKAQA